MIATILGSLIWWMLFGTVNVLFGEKDGGPESRVYVWGLEIKGLFSVLAMRFDQGSREAYHSHAFGSVSWLLSGALHENLPDQALNAERLYYPSWRPIVTRRSTYHKVIGLRSANWVLTFRGPWKARWRDSSAEGDLTLTHGRKVVK